RSRSPRKRSRWRSSRSRRATIRIRMPTPMPLAAAALQAPAIRRPTTTDTAAPGDGTAIRVLILVPTLVGAWECGDSGLGSEALAASGGNLPPQRTAFSPAWSAEYDMRFPGRTMGTSGDGNAQLWG